MQATPTPQASAGCAIAHLHLSLLGWQRSPSKRTPELSFQDPRAGPAAFWFEAESWWLSDPGSPMADDGSRMGQGPRCSSGPRLLQVPSGLAEPRARSPEHPTPAGRAKPSAFLPSGSRGQTWPQGPWGGTGQILGRTEDLVQIRTVSSVLPRKRGLGPCGPCCSMV